MEETLYKVVEVNQKNNTESKTQQHKESINTEDENTLSTIANCFLAVGLISTLICVFVLCLIKNHYTENLEFSPTGFATTIIVLFSTIFCWSIMKVLANISKTLKEINKKLDK